MASTWPSPSLVRTNPFVAFFRGTTGATVGAGWGGPLCSSGTSRRCVGAARTRLSGEGFYGQGGSSVGETMTEETTMSEPTTEETTVRGTGGNWFIPAAAVPPVL